MTHEEFASMCDLIGKKFTLIKQVDELQRQISTINSELFEPVKEIFKPFVGRYFRKTGIAIHHKHCDDSWFMISDIPSEQWSMMNGCLFNEYLVPARFMMNDGMPRQGNVGISPQDFRNDGLTLPEYIVEITEDEWFAEQRRRVHAEADRKTQRSYKWQ